MAQSVERVSPQIFETQMKKVAIITFEFNYNYGAILQATALQYFLTDSGYKVDIVNRGWGKLPPPDKYKTLNIKTIVSHILGRHYTLRNLIRFKKQHWSMTTSFRKDQDIVSCLKKYEAVVIGSDQIWNSACIPVQELYYFGIHTNPENQKVIAYAPSFGKNRFEASPKEIRILSNHLRKFKALSVRETDGCNLMKAKFGIADVPCVLDPTMLMDAKFYIELAKVKKHDNKNLAYYILDMTPEKRNYIDTFAKIHGLIPVNMNQPKKSNSVNPFARLKSLKYPSVETWLDILANAQFVITDSFHGSVFSILFNKQFQTFGNAERGISRFETLLSRFGLEERMIDSKGIIDYNPKEIDYSNVNNIIEEERCKSAKFLRKALK